MAVSTVVAATLSANAFTQRPAVTSTRCVGASAMVPAHHCSHRYARPAHLDVRSAASDGPNDPCKQGVEATAAVFCTRGTKSKPIRTIALVGNSHAWRLLPGLAAYAEQHRWRVVTAARTNCLGLSTRSVAPGGPTKSCLKWSRSVQRQLLDRHDIDAVIFAGYAFDTHFLITAHPTAKQLQAGRAAVLETWTSFQAAGMRVIVTEDVPGMRPRMDPTCIAASHRTTDPCSVRRSKVVRPTLTTALAKANPDLASYIPLDQYFCDAKLCHALIGGIVVYYDSHHMTTSYSKTLGPYLGSAVATVLAMQRHSARWVLAHLATAPASGASTFARSKFHGWIDADHDGCNTRNEVLIAESKTKVKLGAQCQIRSGKWVSWYDGVTTTNSSTFDIDYVVPLGEVWVSGGRQWTTAKRGRYVNDLAYAWTLDAVSAHAHHSKGDQDPAHWLPERSDCRYAQHWVAIKYRWRLSIDTAEKKELTHLLTGACGATVLTVPNRAS